MASIITSRASSGLGELGVLIHHLGEQCLVERAPVDADAYGLLVLDGDFNHGAEVVVIFAADGAVAGVDAVLGERLGAVGVFGEQKVAVVVEVADDGRGPALGVDAFDDVGNGLRGVVIVDGDADHLRAGAGERGDLLDGGLDVRGVGVGHRLDDDRSGGADANAANGNGDGFSAAESGHTSSVYHFAACSPTARRSTAVADRVGCRAHPGRVRGRSGGRSSTA